MYNKVDLKDLKNGQNIYIVNKNKIKDMLGMINCVTILDVKKLNNELFYLHYLNQHDENIYDVIDKNNIMFKSYEDMLDNFRYLTNIENFDLFIIPHLIPHVINAINSFKKIYYISRRGTCYDSLNSAYIDKIYYSKYLRKWRFKLSTNVCINADKLGLRLFFNKENAINKYKLLKGEI